jgi:hypothetical protein
MSLARKSIGSTAMMDGNGSCRPFGLAAGAVGVGVKAVCGLDWCAAATDEARRGMVVAMGRGGATVVVPPSSKCRSNPRGNPANFDFTMFDMAN